jgi:tripartite-type tricarboxylate transporter receptor subunit TctC
MIRLLMAVLALVAIAAPVHAQTFPTKPVRMIVPFPPGGGTDFVSRLVATELAKSTGWTVVVENKSGAGGTIGLVEAVRAPNEGYDMVMGQADNLIIAPAVQKNPGLDPLKDLTPVIQVASSPFLFMGSADSKFKNLKDVIAAAKANPKAITYGTAGHGTFAQLAAVLLMQAADFNMEEVPYKGAAPAMTDLLGGHISMPDVPTVAEQGFKDFEAGGWLGILVPNGTPPAVIARLNLEIGKVMQLPEVKSKLIAQGVEAKTSTPEQFAAMMKSDTTKWHKIVKDAGIKPE